MPYVDLESADDYASIYYRTNAPYGNVGGFDPKRATIVLLHPLFLDSSWLDNQFGDPRLNDNYNLIAFDMRVKGRSVSRPTAKHDSWVEAADLAFCFLRLQLPQSHIFAHETLSVNCAMRFSILFPELCASLALCNVPPPTELTWAFTAYDELLQRWCFAPDLESFEFAATEALRFLAGPDHGTDLQDDLIEYWEMWNHPGRRVRTVEEVNTLMNRVPLTSEHYSLITQPVLIIQGDRCETTPVKFAEKLVADLTNVKGGAVLYTVKGACSYLAVVPGHASIVNQVFTKFLSRLPAVQTEQPLSISERMTEALERLAEIMGDRSITARDPLSSLSFCCLAPEAIKSQSESIRVFRKDENAAFIPLNRHQRPFGRYSERTDKHWFHGEKDGLSYAGSLLPPPTKPGSDNFEKPHMSDHDPPAVEVQRGRLRRATISPSTVVDKAIIKGSMSKVVGVTSPSSFTRLLV